MTTITRKQNSSFPEVATIRKGGAKKKMNKNGREIEVVGDDLKDKFRVVFAPGAEDIAKRFQEVYKTDQPTKIRAMIPFTSVSKAWEYYSEAYNAGRLIARADEDKFLVYRNPLTGEYEVRDGEPFKEFHPGMKIAYDRDGRHYELALKCTGRLKLWLPEVCMIPGPQPMIRMVYFNLKTTSYYDCMNISANLRAVQDLAEALPGQNSNAAGIPIIIYRKEQEICWNKPDGSAQRVKKWLIQIEMDPQFVAAAFQRMSQFAMTGAMPAGMLESGVTVAQPASEIALAVDPEQDDDEPEHDSVDEQPVDAQEGDWRKLLDEEPATQSHPPIDPPVDDRTPEAAPINPLRYAQQTIAAAPHTGKALTRPMSPEVVKAALTVKSDGFRDRPVTPKQTGLAAMLLEQVYSGQPEPKKIRYSVTNYLFGHESLNDVKPGDIHALLDWLKPTKQENDEYLVDAMAAKEASNLFAAANRAAGQMELPL
jgi:hypothetical protein